MFSISLAKHSLKRSKVESYEDIHIHIYMRIYMYVNKQKSMLLITSSLRKTEELNTFIMIVTMNTAAAIMLIICIFNINGRLH